MATAKMPEDDTLPPETFADPDSPDPASPPPDPLSLSQRRASAQALTPLLLGPNNGRNNVCTPEVLEETQVTGIAAYAEFLEHRLQVEGDIPIDEREDAIQIVERQTHRATTAIAERNSSPEPTAQNLSKWRQKGKLLSELAKSFERSEERKRVLREAQKTVNHEEDVTREEFLEMLDGLFQDRSPAGTAHQILLLFTFISDIIVLSLKKNGSRLFARFLDWGIEFILNKVSTWVANNGGWDVVLGQQWTYITAGAKVLLAGVCLYVTYRLAKSAVGSLRK